MNRSSLIHIRSLPSSLPFSLSSPQPLGRIAVSRTMCSQSSSLSKPSEVSQSRIDTIVRIPISVFSQEISQLLHSLFVSYALSFKKAYPIFLQIRPVLSLPVQPSQDPFESTPRRSSSSSRKSFRRKFSSTVQSTVPSKLDINQFLDKRTPQVIWLEPCNSDVNHECVCIWNEEKQEKTDDHFKMNYYTCRCSSCSTHQVVDETDDLVHLIDFFVSVILQPDVRRFIAPSSIIA